MDVLVPQEILDKLFPEDHELGEESMFLSKCKEINRWGLPKDRVIIQSTHHIYMLNAKEVTKKIPIIDLKYYIKSTLSNELLLFFDDDSDLRLIFDEREEMLSYMKMRFANLAPKKSLAVYGVPQ
mgnify:CR=1 FL=1